MQSENWRRHAIVAALAASGTLQACAMLGPTGGALFTSVDTPVNATMNQAGTREGESCSANYFGMIALGDGSIEKARQNGGISMISTVDRKTTQILGLYSKTCTIVRGR